MESDSFNEFELAENMHIEEVYRLVRERKGIDEAEWQAEQAIWLAWVNEYEQLSNNIKYGFYSIAHCYDNERNLAEN